MRWCAGALAVGVKWSINLENSFCEKTPLHNIARACSEVSLYGKTQHIKCMDFTELFDCFCGDYYYKNSCVHFHPIKLKRVVCLQSPI